MLSLFCFVSIVSLAVCATSIGRHHHLKPLETNRHISTVPLQPSLISVAANATFISIDDGTGSAKTVVEAADHELAEDDISTRVGDHGENTDDSDNEDEDEDENRDENDKASQYDTNDPPNATIVKTKTPSDNAQFDNRNLPNASIFETEQSEERAKKFEQALAAKRLLEDNLIEQHRITSLINSYRDEATFNSYVNAESATVAAETKAQAFADMLGAMRKEMRRYSTPSYLEKLAEKRSKLQADETNLKAHFDAAQALHRSRPATLRGAEEAIKKNFAMLATIPTLWGGLLIVGLVLNSAVV
eukprot:TRINITY_DN946_c0_g1_i1.p1 TRINITY_DN946_c0_g1~~TRINITY_DN946_c0_g1_i1.p1  ORF type:complete len:303 (-),score=65.61 TRINITY_DN946_c0_g1_i1:110-1018(-)